MKGAADFLLAWRLLQRYVVPLVEGGIGFHDQKSAVEELTKFSSKFSELNKHFILPHESPGIVDFNSVCVEEGYHGY